MKFGLNCHLARQVVIEESENFFVYLEWDFEFSESFNNVDDLVSNSFLNEMVIKKFFIGVFKNFAENRKRTIKESKVFHFVDKELICKQPPQPFNDQRNTISINDQIRKCIEKLEN